MPLNAVFNGSSGGEVMLTGGQIARWRLKSEECDDIASLLAAYSREHQSDVGRDLDALEQRFAATNWMRFALRGLLKLKTAGGETFVVSPDALEGAVRLISKCSQEGVTDGIRVHLFYDMLATSADLAPADIQTLLVVVKQQAETTFIDGLYRFGLLGHPAMGAPLPEAPLD